MIEVTGLTKSYGARRAVDDASFTVLPGHVTGFLGPNGAGKSTTMRVILGLDIPDRGRANICGVPYRALDAPTRRVGAVLDAPVAHPGRTAHASLRILAAAGRIGPRRVFEVLEQTGLAHLANQYVGRFSTGMRARLGIAAALLGDPEVLILDEPTNGLDPEGMVWIRTLLSDLAGGGRTVLVSSHLLSELEQTLERVVVIVKGRVVADCPINDLTGDGGLSEIRVVTPDAAALTAAVHGAGGRAEQIAKDEVRAAGLSKSEVAELVKTHGVRVFEMTSRRWSLQDAFLKLTAQDAEHRPDQADRCVEEAR
jgi:ABC-2 type transport system ATP-binding protein